MSVLRPGLALAMLEDVLASVAKTLHQGPRGLAGIAVVTLDPAARSLARGRASILHRVLNLPQIMRPRMKL